MIKGIHSMFYAPNAEELRTFIRDKLGLAWTDVGGGWLIFDVASAELGCHPAERTFQDFSFYCDDIYKTVTELTERGVEFSGGVVDRGYGHVTAIRLPGGSTVELYQPTYETRHQR